MKLDDQILLRAIEAMEMWLRIMLVTSCLVAPALHASEGCDPGFIQQYKATSLVADSLRPDKSGLMRVYAFDGSEILSGTGLVDAGATQGGGPSMRARRSSRGDAETRRRSGPTQEAPARAVRISISMP